MHSAQLDALFRLKMWYDDVLFVYRSYSLEERLLNIGEKKNKHIDANGIDMQILSLGGPMCSFLNRRRGLLVQEGQ